MPTRLYLPGPTLGPYTPTPSTAWEVITGFSVRKAERFKTDAGSATITTAKGSGVSNDDRLQRIYITDPLAAQTIAAGTFSMVLRVVESVATADFWMQVILRVMSGDGVTERGVLYGGSTAVAESATVGNEAEEYPTTSATRIKNAIATASVVAQDGDRIHIEIGARGNTTTTADTFSHTYSDIAGSADFALTSGLTTNIVPWIEFSVNLAWMPNEQIVRRVNDKARYRAANW